MTKRHSFSVLKNQIGEARLKKAEAQTRRMIADMLLPEIRKRSGMTQTEIAHVLGVTQPNLSRLEHQNDIQISTLSKLIEALGGHIEIIAHLPQGDCRLTQFQSAPTL